MCAGVAGSAFPVTIDPAATADDLKKAITKAKSIGLAHVEPDSLQLFLARRGASNWLSDESDEVTALEEWNASLVRDLLHQRLLESALGASDAFRDLHYRTIHVLVVDPQTAKKLLLSASIHSETRRRRWLELNEKLDRGRTKV